MVISFLFLKLMCSSHERLPGHLEGVKENVIFIRFICENPDGLDSLKIRALSQAVQTLLRLGRSSLSEALKWIAKSFVLMEVMIKFLNL